MSFFSSLLGINEPALGVDIGTTSIKAVELKRGKDRFEIQNYAILETYGYLERFNEAIQTSSLKLSEKTVSGYLKTLLDRSGIKTRSAVASVPAFMAFSTLVEVPAMSEGEIKKFIEVQAKQFVPMPLTEVALDWTKVGERADSKNVPKSQILLVSIPNEHILRYQAIFKDAGLKLASVEIEGMSIARALSAEIKEPAMVIDIGSRSTSFSIVQNGFLKFSGQTDFSGGSLTHTIATGLSINEKRAEDLKRQRGLLGFGAEHELSTLITPILDVIMSEARRVVTNYESNYGEKVTSAVLSGGGANLAGIEDYIGKYFGMPVTRANPLRGLQYPDVLDAVRKDTGPLLSVALGLALKRFT